MKSVRSIIILKEDAALVDSSFLRCLAVAGLLASFAGLAGAETRHPCADDAIAKAEPLLMLHYGYQPGEKPENLAIEQRVRVLPPIRALKGKGRFDVLEVMASIYKADYRMRFIYAQIKGECVLMGQEILEASDPY
jgi:hypothetical protein